MVTLTQYSNDQFEREQAFTPTYPDTGKKIEGVTLWVRSSKSKGALPIIDSVSEQAVIKQLKMQQTGEVKVDTKESIENDVKLACAVLVRFEGLSDENGKEIKSNDTTIKELMANYDWLRSQVLTKANTASFFYKSE